MGNIIINLKGESNLVISSRINKTDKKELEDFLQQSWRFVNMKFKDKKDNIEYKLFLLGLTDKYLRKEHSKRAKEKATKKNKKLDETKIEIKIKDESKEFYEVQEADLERINKYDECLKNEILSGLKFNRETGLTLEKVNSFLRLSLTEQKIKRSLIKFLKIKVLLNRKCQMEYSLKDILFRTYEDRQQIEIEEEVETDSKKNF